jgi:ATP-dependent Clp protease ATP-binding subunit ClpA
MARAHFDAKNRQQDQVIGANLILGILSDGESGAVALLRHRGVDIEALRAEFESELPEVVQAAVPKPPAEGGCSVDPRQPLPWFSAMESVQRIAITEVRRRALEWVGTEHLLAGLMSVPDAVNVATLDKFGVNSTDIGVVVADLQATVD